MLGKLFKYEWKGFRLPLLIMLIVLAGTTVMTCALILTINPNYSETASWYSMLALMLSIFLYYFGIIGCSLGIMITIAVRFYKTCYTDQGYLTHTLPVSTQKILNVKIISSIAAVLLMILAVIASLFIIAQVAMHHIFSLARADFQYLDYKMFFREIFSIMLDEFDEGMGISLGMYLVYMAVYFVIATMANIVTILGCVSLGQLYAKHRIIGAIAAYFLVQVVMQLLGYISYIPMYTRMLAEDSYYDDYTVFRIMSPTMNMTLLFTVVIAVIMYFVNLHMMTKRLNLE